MPDKIVYRTYAEAQAAWQAHRPALEAKGIHMPGVRSYLPEEFKQNPLAMDEAMSNGTLGLAYDAPPLMFTDANSAVPALLTTLIDPDVFRILFSPNKAAEILGEEKKGTWIDDVAMFPVIEATGEVSSYGDYNRNGNAGINTGWPQRQNYIFQVIKEYGERETERGSLARINWVSELDKAAALTISKFLNFSYFFGIQGLFNYGLANEPNLSASLTPGPKVAGGTAWIVAGNINATANEIYADIQKMYIQLVAQTAGLVDTETAMVLALSTNAATALTATNSFNVNVEDLLKKNFPNIKIITVPQYNSAAQGNPVGVPSGNFAQLIATEIEGQKTGYASYSEKQRNHPVVRDLSSFAQKVSAGTWGTILRMPAAVVGLVGL